MPTVTERLGYPGAEDLRRGDGHEQHEQEQAGSGEAAATDSRSDLIECRVHNLALRSSDVQRWALFARYGTGLALERERGVKGAIAAGHPLTAAAGARVLEAGGTAVDACVAAAFVSWVCESPLTGPGGGDK